MNNFQSKNKRTLKDNNKYKNRYKQYDDNDDEYNFKTKKKKNNKKTKGR